METAGKIPGFMHSYRDATNRKQSEKTLQIQRDLGFALASERSLDGALQISLGAVIELDGIDCGGIYLKEKNGPRLRLRAHRHLSAKFVEGTGIFEAESPEWDLFMAGRPIYLHGHGFHDPSLQEEGIKAFAVIPILNEGLPLACFNVASRTLDDLPPLSRAALEEISTQIGGVITRIAAVDKLRESVNRYRLPADKTTDIIPAETSSHLIELDLLTAKGNRKTIAWKNSVIRDTDGHIVGTLSSGADVTQQKQAEAQLQKSRELLQTIFDGISDTGTGISEDQVQNIFNPFFTTKSTGTGLGLAISHKIVEQHGGLITCENGDDGGARFTIEFPKPGDNV